MSSAERQKALRLERESKGLCVTCGKELEDKNFKNCEACRKKFREVQKERCMTGKYVKSQESIKKDSQRYKLIKAERISKGLCIYCGKENKTSYKSCDECRAYKAKNQKTNREYKEKLGLCNACGKFPVFNDEKMCPECRAKNAKKCKEYRDLNLEQIRINDRKSRKLLRQSRVESGLCGCGRKPIEGKKQCSKCLQRGAKKRLSYRIKNNIMTKDEKTEYAVKNGLCVFCLKPAIPNSSQKHSQCRLCIDCYKQRTKNLPQNNQNHHWRKYNKAAFN